jgi:hypothetical protein
MAALPPVLVLSCLSAYIVLNEQVSKVHIIHPMVVKELFSSDLRF